MWKQVRMPVLFVGLIVLVVVGVNFVEYYNRYKVDNNPAPTVAQVPGSSPTPIAEATSNPSSKPSASPTTPKPSAEPTMHESAPEPEPVIDSTPSSLIPILMGEDYKGVAAAMHRDPDETYPGVDYASYNGWTYKNYTPKHNLYFLFDREKRKVMSAMWIVNKSSPIVVEYSSPTRPEVIIPKEIWDSVPEGIYRGWENSIVVLWKYDGNNYLAHLTDSTRKLTEDITGINENGNKYWKTRMTPAAKDFRACDNLMAFGYIKGYQRFFWDQPGYGVSGHFTVSYSGSMTFYPE